MREIKFRAWNEHCKEFLDEESLECPSFSWGEIKASYLLEQYTGLRDKNNHEIYEGDVIKVLTDRVPKYECFGRSQYDAKKIEARATIIFKYFQWMLDIKNDFNAKIIELRGHESDERRLTIREDLKDYDFFQENIWNREHNAHAYWCDIEVIGNIHENPELLK